MKKIIYSFAVILSMLLAGCNGNSGANFEEAHANLKKQRKELAEFRQNHKLVEKKGVFKKDYDNSNQEKYASMISEYTTDMCDVYGEELKYLISQNESSATARATVLMTEWIQEISYLKSLTEDDDFKFHGKGEEVREGIYTKAQSFAQMIETTAKTVGNTEFLDGGSAGQSSGMRSGERVDESVGEMVDESVDEAVDGEAF